MEIQEFIIPEKYEHLEESSDDHFSVENVLSIDSMSTAEIYNTLEGTCFWSRLFILDS